MAYKTQLLLNQHFQELNPVVIGEEQCISGHCVGPRIRNHTLIHYVRKGSGTLRKGSNTYTVREGEAFLILPGETVTYTADREDPWEYQWIGFDGSLSARFSELPAVFPASDAAFYTLRQYLRQSAGMLEYHLTGWLFSFYADLFGETAQKRDYVRQVIDHVQISYMMKLSVEQMAAQLGLDRHYLSRLFKQRMGVSIRDYILSVRMEQAKQFLRQGFGVKETAYLCGYQDEADFYRLFKKTFSVSPKEYRLQSNQKNNSGGTVDSRK